MLGRYEPGSLTVHMINVKPTGPVGTSTNGKQIVSSVTPYRQAAVQACNTNAALTAPLDTAGNFYVCNAANSLIGCIVVGKGETVQLPEYGDLSKFYLATNVGGGSSCTVWYTT